MSYCYYIKDGGLAYYMRLSHVMDMMLGISSSSDLYNHAAYLLLFDICVRLIGYL